MLAVCVVLALCLVAVHGDSVAVTTSTTSGAATLNTFDVQSDRPDVYSLHITSHIQHRYAVTVVTSRVANRANRSQEIFFSFVMPETAFISGFIMEIDGVEYKAHVKEKEEARRDYQAAVSHGLSAAHVAQSARDSNRFKVSVNIEPSKKVTFTLNYEELLKRKLSFYTQAINIDPGQIVADLSVEVHINESSSIKNLQVPVLRESNEIDPQGYSEEDPYAEIEATARNTATVRWAPTEDQQRQLRAEGIQGQLSVRYDLDRTSNPEQILVNDGYFVHFFSPEELAPLPKHVVFVIDVSGSMNGRKMEQLRDAMTRILSDLSPRDYFSIVTFSTNVQVWDLENPFVVQHRSFGWNSGDTVLRDSSIVPATSDNVNTAKEFIRHLEDYASTNIHGALMKGLQVAQRGKEITVGQPEPMIIFLTDGDANIGESNPERIAATVTDANSGGVAIFSLAFGEYADMKFLKKLSLKNSGFARKIYEASDASLQLQDFYRQISSPLLANVTFGYTENQVEEGSLSTTKFNTLFRGSELVVCGKLTSDNVTGAVTARSANGSFTLDYSPAIRMGRVHSNNTPSSMEKLWAYLTIQQLLEKNAAGTGNSSVIHDRALNLALGYSFVTPLTSLVVVKPNETSSTNVEKGDVASPRYSTSGVSAVPVPRRLSASALATSHPRNRNFQSRSSAPSDTQDRIVLHSIISRPRIPHLQPRLRVIPLRRLTWLDRTGNSTTLTLQQEVLQVKTANQNNEAFSACSTTLGRRGHCRHLVNCALNVFQNSILDYYPFFCRIDDYAGVCCPDILQPVVVHS